ncbi:hypothetical protein CC86DRAFT_377581 [Ophiobolus disseminans]|uniref:Uncharacterized protein n=1 Tax=Ophiobolus disseminans TaxID=1469910 RepID=A0A6A7AIB5_9PLEO|nr:hypothetical protein CC86DRAFT_377581 [Ophiobolus disseminans]
MKQLAHSTPATRFPEEFPNTRSKVQYVADNLLRFINKLLGLPAKRQTAMLAEVIRDLKTGVETVLSPGQQVTHAVVTSPDSIRLLNYEMNDVLDYLHIANAMADPNDLYAAAAAYAGNGYGLCLSFADRNACDWEALDFPRLERGFKCVRGTVRGYRTGVGSFLCEEMKELFKDIGASIEHFVKKSCREVTVIIATGPQVGDARFKETLRDALKELVAPHVMMWMEVDSDAAEVKQVFATAMGAAEVAKRRRKGPVRCRWKKRCGVPPAVGHGRSESDSRHNWILVKLNP